MTEFTWTIITFMGIIGGVFGIIFLWDFCHNIPFKYPMTIVIYQCDHINGLGEQLPSTYTVWAKNIFGINQSVFMAYNGWDWEGDHPYPKHFNSLDEVNLALEDRLRNIIKTSCDKIY